MIAAQDKHRVQRITLLLGDGESTRSALELLTLLAEEQSAEVLGLFVEDSDLLGLAHMSFTRELCRLTYTERPLEAADIERQLRIQARSAQLALEAAAKQAGLAYSFRAIRGAVAALLQEAAQEMDMMILAPAQRSRRIPGPITLATIACQSKRPVVVAFDDSVSSVRALLMAKRLAEVGKRELTVLVTPTAREDSEALRNQAEEKLSPVAAHYRHLLAPDIDALLESSHREKAGTLVLGLTDKLLGPGSLQKLNQHLECPALLVR